MTGPAGGSSIIGVINPTTGVATDLALLASGANADGLTYDAMNGGYLWFTDKGLNKIGYINPGGNVAELNTTPAGDSEPDAIVADSSGNLWVSFYGSGTVDRFTPTGSGSWLSTPITLGGGSISFPTGITDGPDGNIWVVESGQVQVINPSTLAITKSIPISGTGSITPRPEDSSVWVTTSTSVVSIATGTYAQTTYTMPTTMGGPVSVVADQTDHNVYFTAPGTSPANLSYYPDAVGVITLNSASQPDHLAITTPPPTNVTKGVGFGLVVGVDTSNNVVDGFLNTIDASIAYSPPSVDALGGSVTISLGANPNGDTLGGTLTEPINNGVAVFSGLTLDNPGPGEILSISYTGLSSISSSPITVALAATKLAVAAQPPLTVGAGQVFTLAFEAVDSNGNLDTSYNGPISVTTGVNPTGASLGGTTLVGATNGIATFNTLTLSEPGPGYTVQGSDPNGGLNPISSRAFTVTSGPAASISSTAGTTQSAAVGTAFATAFQATVNDQNGYPVSGVSVTFAAPASGAGGHFASGGTTTVTTNSSGVATAPAFTANTVAGSYSVTATAAGVSAGATFDLSNTAGAASTITATTGTPQSAAVGMAFASAFQATVKDQYGNPVSGVSVTFAAPASGAGGRFAGGGTATVTTNSVGVATAPAFTANTMVGSYTVTATVAGVSAGGTFSLSNAVAVSSMTAVSGTGTYAGTGILTATLTANGSGLADESVDFTLDDNGTITDLGSVTTDADGVAKLTGVSLAGFDAGTVSIAVGASFAGDSTHASISNSGDLAVSPASATLSVSGLTTAYDAAPHAATVTTTPAGLTGVTIAYTQNGDPVSAPTTAGSYTVTVSLRNANYIATPVTVTLVINRVTPTIEWANPAAITYGTSLSVTQLDATASVSGNFNYTPGKGTVLNVGNGQALSVTFTPSDTTDFNTVTTTVKIDVVAPPVVTVTSFQPTTVSVEVGKGHRAKTKKETALLLQFSGAVAGTGNLAAYQLRTGATKSASRPTPRTCP